MVNTNHEIVIDRSGIPVEGSDLEVFYTTGGTFIRPSGKFHLGICGTCGHVTLREIGQVDCPVCQKRAIKRVYVPE